MDQIIIFAFLLHCIYTNNMASVRYSRFRGLRCLLYDKVWYCNTRLFLIVYIGKGRLGIKQSKHKIQLYHIPWFVVTSIFGGSNHLNQFCNFSQLLTQVQNQASLTVRLLVTDWAISILFSVFYFHSAAMAAFFQFQNHTRQNLL